MGIAVSPQIHPKVAEFLEKPRKMLINGQWVSSISGKTFPTYNPSTGEVLAQVAEGDREDIEQAVKAARKAFEEGKWSKIGPHQRARYLLKIADLIERNADELATLETLNNGMAISLARNMVAATANVFRYYAGRP